MSGPGSGGGGGEEGEKGRGARRFNLGARALGNGSMKLTEEVRPQRWRFGEVGEGPSSARLQGRSCIWLRPVACEVAK